jgi:hypothetical protein
VFGLESVSGSVFESAGVFGLESVSGSVLEFVSGGWWAWA